MITILNRVAWLVSISFGYAITSVLFNPLYYYIKSTNFVGPFILSLIAGLLVKKIFLSRSFIKGSLDGLESKVKENVGEEKEKIEVAIPETADENISTGGMQDEFKKTKEVVLDSEGLLVERSGKKIESKAESSSPWYSSVEVNEEEETPTPEISVSHFMGEEVSTEKEGSKEEQKKPEKSEPGFLQKFFAENALAKIGGILLFLGVLFLLQLVYEVIGPIGKLMAGFLIGMILFAIGAILDSKGHKKEARIVIGTSILINYLVILSGRYLIEESSMMGKTILNEGVTFFFLIVNTVFAIAASLAYRSHALLFFAFVISYLNPFLVGAEEVYTPYTLLGYSLIVSFGALSMSYFLLGRNKIQSLNLTHVAFLGGSILILAAPFTLSSEWIVKLAALTILSFITIMFLYRQKNYPYISTYFIVVYIFFFILLQIGGVVLGSDFRGFGIFLSYSLFAFMALGSTVYLFLASSLLSLFYIFFAPLVIFLILILSGMASTDSTIWLLILTMISYIAIFSLVSNRLIATMKYFLFGVLGIFVVMINFFLGNISKALSFEEISFMHIFGIMISTYVFYLSAYFFSTKKGLESLYSLGTLFGILMVLPIISREGEFRMMSIIGISGLIVFNFLLPLVNRKLLESNIQNLVFGVVIGAVFAVSQVYYFMFGGQGNSPMTLGLIFLSLALVCFGQSYFMYSAVLKSKRENEESDQKPLDTNIFYTFVGISISIFSLAVAFIFSGSPEIVSIVWLLEASLLYFFYRRTNNIKIFSFAIVIMIIGLTKILSFIDRLSTGDYFSLIPVIIIFASIVLSLKFLENEKRNLRTFHDLGHIVGIVLLIVMLLQIIPSHSGYNTLALALFAIPLFMLYSHIFSAQTKYFLLFYLFVVMGLQVLQLDTIFRYLERSDTEAYKILQHLSTLILAAGIFAFNVLAKHYRERNKIKNDFFTALNIISAIYFFVITTQYVYHLIDKNVFVVSIYWGLLAFFFLTKGINTDTVKYRTLGLYILSLAVAKIVLNDIWNGLDDAVMRVVALMFVGGILITVSLLYSKKYGNQLKGEFSLDNLLKEEKGEIISKEENK